MTGNFDCMDGWIPGYKSFHRHSQEKKILANSGKEGTDHNFADKGNNATLENKKIKLRDILDED